MFPPPTPHLLYLAWSIGTVGNPLTSSTGLSQSRAICEVVAPVALLSGIALSRERPVWYAQHRGKVVFSLRSPSLARLGLGLPLLIHFSSRSDRLAPYCFSTFLASTHNYMARIHNYFFTFRTMTMVPHGLPLGGWYYTIFFLSFECAAKLDGPFGLPRTWIMPSLVTPVLNIRDLLKWLLCVCFLFFLSSDDPAMGFPDSSCLVFDLIPFGYLLS